MSAHVEVLIEDIKFPNIGIGKAGEKHFAIKGALPGQRVEARVTRRGKSAKGEVVRVLEPSPMEVAPDCPVFGRCGGCSFQNIPYDYELELKDQMVKKVLAPFDVPFLPPVGAVSVNGYRNKMEFSFGDDGLGGALTLGMRKKGSYYEVVNAECCRLVHPDFAGILSFTLEYYTKAGLGFYHRKHGTGTLRHLIIRKSWATGEILVMLVTTSGEDCRDYAAALSQIPLAGRIVGILHVVNDSVADAVVPQEVRVLHGADFYREELLGLTFKVTAFSFFQTNTQMAEVLYSQILEVAGNLGDKTVFDLYCGTGTIALVLAPHAKEVLGIELVEEAVAAAQENMKINNITNCEFICGDVRKIVKNLEKRPDVIVLDPPREGLNPKCIPDIIAFGAKKIIYVSCKATSLANDLTAFVAAGYEVKSARCIDLFPRTANVEVIILLEK